MQQIVCLLPIHSGKERIGVVRIGCNVQIGAVNGQKPKSMIQIVFINLVCEILEKEFKCLRKDFRPTLDIVITVENR